MVKTFDFDVPKRFFAAIYIFSIASKFEIIHSKISAPSYHFKLEERSTQQPGKTQLLFSTLPSSISVLACPPPSMQSLDIVPNSETYSDDEINNLTKMKARINFLIPNHAIFITFLIKFGTHHNL